MKFEGKIMLYEITPIPKPRQTQRDRWGTNKRPCVARYHSFRDRVRLLRIQVPEGGSHITFYMPMPKSWSAKKKKEMAGKPHQQKSDIDNILKALLDAVYEDDCVVYDIRASKYWSFVGRIEITGGADL